MSSVTTALTRLDSYQSFYRNDVEVHYRVVADLAVVVVPEMVSSISGFYTKLKCVGRRKMFAPTYKQLRRFFIGFCFRLTSDTNKILINGFGSTRSIRLLLTLNYNQLQLCLKK